MSANGLTYDTGALIAAERDDRILWSLHRAALSRGIAPTVPVGVLAPRQHLVRVVAGGIDVFRQAASDVSVILLHCAGAELWRGPWLNRSGFVKGSDVGCPGVPGTIRGLSRCVVGRGCVAT